MKICSAKFNGEGGAISLDETSSLTLINVTFKENSAIGIYGEGGAIYSTGTLKIYDSKFEDNYASGAGGAVYSLTSNCEIDSSKFNNNSAKWYGGAIFSNYQLIVSSSTFTQNNAYSGGVLHYTLTQVADIESAIFNRTLFSKNAAIYGGVFSTSALNKIIALNSSFTENYATRGGILYKNGQSASYIQNCLVENNSAEFGAVICDDSYDGYYKNRITFNGIINSTLNNNFALKSSIYSGRAPNIRRSASGYPPKKRQFGSLKAEATIDASDGVKKAVNLGMFLKSLILIKSLILSRNNFDSFITKLT